MTPPADGAMGHYSAHILLRVALLLFGSALPLTAEVREPAGDIFGQLGEIVEIVRGVHSFLSGIAIISETIGFATVLLFLGVIVFSAGFTAVGVPKGIPSFIVSLVTADILWVLWNIAIKASPGECVAAMIRSNIIIIAPAVIAAVAARGAARLRRSLGGLVRPRALLDGEQAASLLREYQERSSRLSSALAEDIIFARKGDGVRLTGKTLDQAGKLGETIEKIRERSGKQPL